MLQRVLLALKKLPNSIHLIVMDILSNCTRDHILFTCSSIYGHLGYLLVIMMNPSVNVHVKVSVGTYFFTSFEYILRVEFLGHMVNLYLTFK